MTHANTVGPETGVSEISNPMAEIQATLRSSPEAMRTIVSQGFAIIRAAKREAERIKTEARREAASRIKQAYKRSQKRSYREAQRVLKERFLHFEKDLAAIREKHEQLVKEQTVSLAIQLTEELLQSELIANKASVEQRFAKLYQNLSENSPLQIHCHPDMHALIEKSSSMPVYADRSIPFGDIAIQTSVGRLQTDLNLHFQSLKQYIWNHKDQESEED